MKTHRVVEGFRYWLGRMALALMMLLATPLSMAQVTDKFTPTSDFINNGDGTVTHVLTGLTWMRCAMGQTWTGSTCSGEASDYTFAYAQALTSNFAGKSDWRLPDVLELLSITEFGKYKLAINSTIFPGTSKDRFWILSLYLDLPAGQLPQNGKYRFIWYSTRPV